MTLDEINKINELLNKRWTEKFKSANSKIDVFDHLFVTVLSDARLRAMVLMCEVSFVKHHSLAHSVFRDEHVIENLDSKGYMKLVCQMLKEVYKNFVVEGFDTEHTRTQDFSEPKRQKEE